MLDLLDIDDEGSSILANISLGAIAAIDTNECSCAYGIAAAVGAEVG